MTCKRGTSNSNSRGNTKQRRSRREYLVRTYRADKDLMFFATGDPRQPSYFSRPFETFAITVDGVICDMPLGEGEPACRCYRCGTLLTVDTVTADRIVPGCVKTKEFPKGGTYKRSNIRPCCDGCNSKTGGALGAAQKKAKAAPKRVRANA